MSWARGEAVLARAAGARLTYADVGVSLRPGAARGLDVRRTVGSGDADFDAAVRAVLGWRMHRGIGLRVLPTNARAQVGVDVALGLGVGPARVVFACRVVAVVEEEDARGFAYGTLPGHPQCGEESFLVRRAPSGEVFVEIRAVSRPGWRLVAAAAPAARLAQRAAAEGYARAVRSAVVAAR